jgi:hypothetical protein
VSSNTGIGLGKIFKVEVLPGIADDPAEDFCGCDTSPVTVRFKI